MLLRKQALLESRFEREGKDRLDYIDQASKIIDECFQGCRGGRTQAPPIDTQSS